MPSELWAYTRHMYSERIYEYEFYAHTTLLLTETQADDFCKEINEAIHQFAREGGCLFDDWEVVREIWRRDERVNQEIALPLVKGNVRCRFLSSFYSVADVLRDICDKYRMRASIFRTLISYED